MTNKTKVALVTLGVVGAAVGVGYFVVPPIIKNIKASTGNYDSFDNNLKRFVTTDKLGRAMLATGVVIISAGALTYGIQGLSYMVKHNTNFVNQFS